MKGICKHIVAALSLLFAVSILLTSCLNPRVPDKGMMGGLTDDGAGQETVIHEPNDSILPGNQGWDTDVLWDDETDSMTSEYETAPGQKDEGHGCPTDIPCSCIPETTGPEITWVEDDTTAPDTTETVPQTTPIDPAGDDLDFSGMELDFLAPLPEENAYDLFLPIEVSEDRIELSMYQRKLRIEEKLNIRLEVKYVKDAPKTIQTHVYAGDYAFAVSLLPENTLHSILSQGLMRDLLKLPYLDLWGEGFDVTSAKAYQADGTMFAVSGDVTLSRIKETQAFFYNATQVDAERMVELVKNGEWTLERYLTMSKGVAAGNAIRQVEMLYFGSGNRLVAPDANDDPSAAWDANRIEELVLALSKAENPLTDAPQADAFFTGDTPFLAATLGEMLKRDVSFACGVLPPPKLDAEQRYYATTAVNPLMITVPVTTIPTSYEGEATGAVLHAMCAEAEPITAAYRERLADHLQMESADRETLDLVCEAVVWDLGAGSMERSGILAVANQTLFPCDMKTFSVIAQRLEAELADYRLQMGQLWT